VKKVTLSKPQHVEAIIDLAVKNGFKLKENGVKMEFNVDLKEFSIEDGISLDKLTASMMEDVKQLESIDCLLSSVTGYWSKRANSDEHIAVSSTTTTVSSPASYNS
jgi:hypothetical protein